MASSCESRAKACTESVGKDTFAASALLASCDGYITQRKWFEMMSNELKPCPFCGSEADLFTLAKSMYTVDCTNTDCLAGSGIGHTEEEAVELWNRRAVDTDELEKIADRLASQPDCYDQHQAERIRKAVGQ